MNATKTVNDLLIILTRSFKVIFVLSLFSLSQDLAWERGLCSHADHGSKVTQPAALPPAEQEK